MPSTGFRSVSRSALSTGSIVHYTDLMANATQRVAGSMSHFARAGMLGALVSCAPAATPQPAAKTATVAPQPSAMNSASVAPAKPVPEKHAKVLDTIGDVTIASFPPKGFERLTPRERVLAYHLSQAALAGDSIFTRQTSQFALPAQQLVRSLLAAKPGTVEPSVRVKLLRYRRLLFIHHGLHDKWRSRKFEPPLTRAELEQAARAAGVAAPAELLTALFDPNVVPMIVDKTPANGRDPITASAATHYEGVTSKELANFHDTFELNSRVVKRNGRLVEQVYRAGDGKTPPGIGAAELQHVVGHLQAALPLTSPEQAKALGYLIKYFQTGDNALFHEHDIAWVPQVFPVDYIFGFVETYLDVRERKGSFLGFVAIPDPDHDPGIQAIAKNAAYFEQRLPWPAELKRNVFRTPAAAAVTVLAATGDAGPFTFGGANLPNLQELRERYGTKNFLTASVIDTRDELRGARFIEEFAPAEVRAELERCQGSFPYAFIGFHEITGHGSGKVSPTLKADPAKLLSPYYSTMEEGRADLVADYLDGDPKTVELGILPDAGCARVLPAGKTLRLLTNVAEVPTGDRIEEDHLRAAFIELGVMREKGVITVEKRDGKTFFVVKDPDAWFRAAGELLAEHQRIKAYGDRAAMQALVEKYGTRIDTALRDEVVARKKALALPELIATIPPLLSPLLDSSGQVVDAKAEQVASLDAYIDAVERASGF
jgi:dipeptidyl-peptidase-3